MDKREEKREEKEKGKWYFHSERLLLRRRFKILCGRKRKRMRLQRR